MLLLINYFLCPIGIHCFQLQVHTHTGRGNDESNPFVPRVLAGQSRSVYFVLLFGEHACLAVIISIVLVYDFQRNLLFSWLIVYWMLTTILLFLFQLNNSFLDEGKVQLENNDIEKVTRVANKFGARRVEMMILVLAGALESTSFCFRCSFVMLLSCRENYDGILNPLCLGQFMLN